MKFTFFIILDQTLPFNLPVLAKIPRSDACKAKLAIQDGIIIAGDGRHDSMGHSAKFGAYTIFCCTVPMIIHFSLVQVRYILLSLLLLGDAPTV